MKTIPNLHRIGPPGWKIAHFGTEFRPHPGWGASRANLRRKPSVEPGPGFGLPHVAPRCESCSLLSLRKRSSMALFAPLYACTLTLLSESDELTHMESNSCTKSRRVRVEQRTSGESVIPGRPGAMPADSHYLLTSLVLCFVLGGQALAGASAGASAGAGTVRALGPSRSTMIWLSLARSW
jgi:hypothetical protein